MSEVNFLVSTFFQWINCSHVFVRFHWIEFSLQNKQFCHFLSLRELHWWQDLTKNSRSNFLQILIRFFNIYCDCYVRTSLWQSIVIDYGHPMKLFFIKIPNFCAWADTFWGIWGIFGQPISTYFGIVSPLFMFSIIQLLFLQKN